MKTRAIVADDLTGASDAGVQFATRGRRVVVWLDHTQPADTAADLVVVDTDSRFVAPDVAYARVAAVLRALGTRAPGDVVKKIDSTLRGNIGAELRAMLDCMPQSVAIVVPAYPKNGRTTRNGVHYVHDVPVDESDVARDLFSPVGDARVRSHLDGIPSAGLPVESVRAGIDRLSEELDACRRAGARAIVPDVETDADLAAIAALAARHTDVIWAGSAGILEYLAGSGAPVAQPDDVPRAAGPVLFLIGSLSTMTARQIDEFEARETAARLDPILLLENAAGISERLEAVHAAFAQGDDVLVAITPDRMLAEAAVAHGRTRGWATRETSDRLRHALVRMTSPFVRDGATVVLSGGDVARAFCDAHGIRGMELLAETAPGIPISRAIGADIFLVTKAGGFGQPQTYRMIQDALHRKVTA